MKDGSMPAGVAVVCHREGDRAAAMEAHLRSENLPDAEWFAPLDVDDVDEAVCAGRVGRVVFTNLSGLLDAIWDEEVQFDRWLSAGAAVSFVDSPEAESTAAVVFESWRKWSRRHRRRQVVAGIILGAIALATAFLLMWSMS